jgi:hypothetical protein
MPLPRRKRGGARAAVLLAALGAAASCAHREAWEVSAPEVTIEVLPAQAELEADGQPAGRGPLRQSAGDPARVLRLRASAEGYQVLETSLPVGRLGGETVALVLRPIGYGSQRPLDARDAPSLAQAALALLRDGRIEDAMAFASRSLAIAEGPVAHKVLGMAYSRRGDRRSAARHYAACLSLAPGAPDAPEIARALEEARGDIRMSGPGE